MLVLVALLCVVPATAGAAHVPDGRHVPALLRITIIGLPRTAHPFVMLTGVHGFRVRLLKLASVTRLAPGRYRIVAASMRTESVTYTPIPGSQTLSLLAGRHSATTVRYRPARPAASKPSPSGGGVGTPAAGGASTGGSPAAGAGGGAASGGGGGGIGGGSGASAGTGAGGGTATTPPPDLSGPTVVTPAPGGFVCALTSTITGPPKQIVVTVQDATNGIRAVEAATTNATATISPFPVGTTAAILVTATKTDQARGATLVLTITDGNGQNIVCS
jgi:hypothetical protein